MKLLIRAVAVLMAMMTSVVCLAWPAHADTAATGRLTLKSLSNAAGTREYETYVPARFAPNRPLIVWLHGASKVEHGDPQELRRTSTLLKQADRDGYAVVAPRQSLAVDSSGTWKVFDPSNLVRGKGETSIIAAIVKRAAADLHADPRRIYLAGHSAGGAMVHDVSATYPELFAAIMVSAGIPYLGDPTGAAVTAARRGATIPAFIAQGDHDSVTPPLLGGMSMTAAKNANGIAGAVAHVRRMGPTASDRYPTTLSRFGSGQSEVVYAEVHGADHPSGPGGLTVNGPDLDRTAIAFLLSKRRS